MVYPWSRNHKANTVPSLLLRNRWKVYGDLTEDEVSDLLKEEVRDWLELPVDVVFLIFKKLGPLLILYRAQYVCSLWRNLAKEPHLFSSIDIRNQQRLFHSINIENQRRNSLGVDVMKLVHEAAKRSCGRLVEICYVEFCFSDGLRYMVDVSKSLKCLRLVCCNHVTEDEFIQVITKTPLLEELELRKCSFSKEVIKVVGKMCPQLKYFLLHHRYYYLIRGANYDEFAFAIAEHMPGLQQLCLLRYLLTDNGLQAILDGCPYLQYLHVRFCFNTSCSRRCCASRMNLERKCLGRIKHLECPTACVKDYQDYEAYNSYNCNYSRNATRYQNCAREYDYESYYDSNSDGVYSEYDSPNGKDNKVESIDECDDFDTMKFLPAKAATCYL